MKQWEPLLTLGISLLLVTTVSASPAKPALLNSVQTISGKAVNLNSLPGWKVIYFWTDGCPCVKACEHYSFLPLAKKYHGKVTFFAVASSRYDLNQGNEKLKVAVSAHRLPYEVLLDPKHQLAQALSAQVTPQTFLLNPAGQIVFSGMPDDSRRYLTATGKQGFTQTYLSVALAEGLAGKRITLSHTENQGCIIAW